MKNIVFHRRGAMGDVIDVLPIAWRWHQENPNDQLWLLTEHGYVLDGLDWIKPFVNSHGYSKLDTKEMVLYCDLDGVLEADRSKHGIDLYSMKVFGDEKTPHTVHVHVKPVWMMLPPEASWDKVIVVHSARSWAQRTFSIDFWSNVIGHLIDEGYWVASIGTEQDWKLPNTSNGEHVCLVGTMSLQSQLGLINNAACFVCSDTGLMCAAQATRTPIVALLTMSLPFMAQRDRDLCEPKRGWRFYPMIANVPCVGCGHRVTAMAGRPAPTHFECPNAGDMHNACVRSFDPKVVARYAIDCAIRRKQVET